MGGRAPPRPLVEGGWRGTLRRGVLPAAGTLLFSEVDTGCGEGPGSHVGSQTPCNHGGPPDTQPRARSRAGGSWGVKRMGGRKGSAGRGAGGQARAAWFWDRSAKLAPTLARLRWAPTPRLVAASEPGAQGSACPGAAALSVPPPCTARGLSMGVRCRLNSSSTDAPGSRSSRAGKEKGSSRGQSARTQNERAGSCDCARGNPCRPQAGPGRGEELGVEASTLPPPGGRGRGRRTVQAAATELSSPSCC